MTNYYNSGLYVEAFFTKHRIDVRKSYDKISYNYPLISEYFAIDWDEQDEDEISELVDEEFWDSLSMWMVYFEPLIFNEQVALECGLTPFSYYCEISDRELQLLALSSCGRDLSPRLDAYQALTDKTIDKNSKFFGDEHSGNYFTYVVGQDIAQRVNQALA